MASNPHPKFHKCEKVICLDDGRVCTVEDYDFDNGIWSYLITNEEDTSVWLTEDNLEHFQDPILVGSVSRTLTWNHKANTNLWLLYDAPKDNNGTVPFQTEIPLPHYMFPSLTHKDEPRKVAITLSLLEEEQ